MQAQSAAGDVAGKAKSATGDASGSAKGVGGDIASKAKSATGDVKGAAKSAGRQIDQATPDLSANPFDQLTGKVSLGTGVESASFLWDGKGRGKKLFARYAMQLLRFSVVQAQSAAGDVTGKVSCTAAEWQQHPFQLLNHLLTSIACWDCAWHAIHRAGGPYALQPVQSAVLSVGKVSCWRCLIQGKAGIRRHCRSVLAARQWLEYHLRSLASMSHKAHEPQACHVPAHHQMGFS